MRMTLAKCQCGCGELLKAYPSGKPAPRYFNIGHDQKLRAKLEKQVGGLLNLKVIVQNHLKRRGQ